MFPQFQIKKDSTLPWLTLQLFQEGILSFGLPADPSSCGANKQGTPIDLTNAISIKAKMFKCGRTPLEKVLLGTVVVDDAVNGVVTYKWHPSDTDTAACFYFVFEIIFQDNTKLLFPYQLESFSIEVTP